MDRRIVYPGSIPLDSDLLDLQRATLIAMAWTAQGYLGAGTVVDGLACTPTTPASMSVQVAPGQVFSVQNVDSSTYGSLPTDTVHSILKQGLTLDTTQLTLAAPATVGQSVNYLIQVGFSEVDDTPVVLPYYNAANPAQAYSGPNGSGTAQNTFRRGKCLVQTKAGVAAASGSQVTPAPDPGYVGLYVVTVAYGATTVTAGNIVQLATAPFLLTKLPQVPADVQSGKWLYGVDTGTVNALAVTLNPAPATYAAGMGLRVKVAASNTATMTINVNSLGSKSIIYSDGSSIRGGDILAGSILALVYDGTNFQVVNVSQAAIKKTAFRRSQAKFVAAGAFLWTVPAGVTTVVLKGWGAGGGGGFGGNPSGPAGGGSGAYFEVTADVAPGATISGTVGVGGAAGASGVNGGTGTDTTITANGVTYTAGGGTGGTNANANAVTNSASGGNVSGSVDIARPGEPSGGGLQGYSGTGILYYAGKGGTAPNGGQGGQSGSGAGNSGQAPGGGGAGGASGNVAGAGARGEVWIEY